MLSLRSEVASANEYEFLAYSETIDRPLKEERTSPRRSDAAALGCVIVRFFSSKRGVNVVVTSMRAKHKGEMRGFGSSKFPFAKMGYSTRTISTLGPDN